MNYKDKMFYFEISKIKDTLHIVGFEKLINGNYHSTEIWISVFSISKIIHILNDMSGLVMMNIDCTFSNDNDEIEICIEGNDRSPVVKIYGDHKTADGNIEEGVISIPYRPFEEEYVFYYIKPFLEELKKYAV